MSESCTAGGGMDCTCQSVLRNSGGGRWWWGLLLGWGLLLLLLGNLLLWGKGNLLKDLRTKQNQSGNRDGVNSIVDWTSTSTTTNTDATPYHHMPQWGTA